MSFEHVSRFITLIIVGWRTTEEFLNEGGGGGREEGDIPAS